MSQEFEPLEFVASEEWRAGFDRKDFENYSRLCVKPGEIVRFMPIRQWCEFTKQSYSPTLGPESDWIFNYGRNVRACDVPRVHRELVELRKVSDAKQMAAQEPAQEPKPFEVGDRVTHFADPGSRGTVVSSNAEWYVKWISDDGCDHLSPFKSLSLIEPEKIRVYEAGHVGSIDPAHYKDVERPRKRRGFEILCKPDPYLKSRDLDQLPIENANGALDFLFSAAVILRTAVTGGHVHREDPLPQTKLSEIPGQMRPLLAEIEALLKRLDPK